MTTETSADGTKKRRRRRGKGGLGAAPIPCGNVASARLISLFLRSLSPKEKGYALDLLLKLARESAGVSETAAAVNPASGD